MNNSKCCKCHKVIGKGEGRYNLDRIAYCIECWDKTKKVTA